MAISAQTLFHFTKYKYLKSIIKAKAFYPRYSFEVFINQDDFIVLYPMVCFCDIPLSQIYKHALVYHRNGIGLEKEWGIKKGINPVFYIQKESFPAKIIIEAFTAALSHHVPINDNQIAVKTDNPEFLRKFLELTAFYKPREGKIWDKYTNRFQKYSGISSADVKINFYDEREWRYVPEYTTISSYKDMVPVNFKLKEQFYDGSTFLQSEFQRMNATLNKHPLNFEASDIKYLIVSRITDVNYLAKFIFKLRNYTDSEKNTLISKIISLKQIQEDF